jgi:hypothetical protein
VIHLVLDAGLERVEAVRRDAALEAVGAKGPEHDGDACQYSPKSSEEACHRRAVTHENRTLRRVRRLLKEVLQPVEIRRVAVLRHDFGVGIFPTAVNSGATHFVTRCDRAIESNEECSAQRHSAVVP